VKALYCHGIIKAGIAADDLLLTTTYINWAAAMQIQFHVCDLDQGFEGNIENWVKAYLKHFVAQAKKRADDMITKFVKPFEKYI
jgi:type II restriction enzyme